MRQAATVGAAPAYETFADGNAAHRRQTAWRDLSDGARLYRLAAMLGWLDIKLRYRGSVLGPFWLTLSTGVMILSMGVLYAYLFHIDVRTYLPFLGLSLVLWNGLSAMVSEACVCFTAAISTIHAIRMPFTVYAVRTLVRNALVLAHNAVVIVAVYAYFDIWPGTHALLALPGLVLWLIDGVAVCLLLGSLCARFRDIPPIVGSVMQIGFFLTPIIWQPETAGINMMVLNLNPFYPLLAVVREPLLNHATGGLLWSAAVCWSALLCGAAWVLFARVRGRLPFWI